MRQKNFTSLEGAIHSPSHAGRRLDRLPICSFHYRLLLFIGAGLFLDALDIYIQGGVLAELFRTGWTNAAGNARFLSSTFAGLTVGAILAGWLGDRLGRRTIYRANLLVFGLFTLLAAFAPNFHLLLACRFICGLGLGGEVITCYATLSEFVPARQRGKWQGWLALISNLGLPASALLSLLVIPSFGWRAMFLLVGVLALVVWALQRRIPESPRWLEEHHRHAEADELLRGIEKEAEEATGAPVLPLSMQEETAKPAQSSSWRDLFRGELFSRTILAMILMICMNVAVYGVTAWLPTILVQHGFRITSTFRITTIMQIGSLPGALLGAWTVEHWGRKLGLILISGVTAVMAVVYTVTYAALPLALNGFLLILLVYALAGMVYATYVPEIFPTRLRLTGSGVSNSTGRLVNVFAPFGIAVLLTRSGAAAVYYAVALMLVLQALFVLILGIETRGRSLEEIHATPGSNPAAVAGPTESGASALRS